MRTKQKLTLGLAVLAAAAAVLVPTVAFAGDDRPTPAATHDMAGHKMAGHSMAADTSDSMAADSISPSLLFELLRVGTGYGPVPQRRQRAGGRVRARLGERLRCQDHHRLRRVASHRPARWGTTTSTLA